MTNRWGLLLRMSDDGPLGLARQEADLRAMVDAAGGEVARVYRENDTSAFRRRKIRLPDGTTALRVVRPEFRAALEDLAAGDPIDALGVYDIDRLARDPRDLEDLIDVVEQHGRMVRAVTGSLDLSTDHGIAMSRVQVAIANKSSRDTSRRVKRKKRELAEAGEPGGGGHRPYGYTLDRRDVIPAEADVIREVAGRLIAGESLTSLARELNARGVPPSRAGRWHVSALRAVITKPHVTALRVLGEETVGEGNWPAILDRGTWQQVVDVCAGRTRTHPAVRKYLLSGLATCGACGRGKLGAARDTAGLRYRCQDIDCRRVNRLMAPLDEYVIAAVLARLAELDLTPPRPPAAGDPAGAEMAGLEKRRADVVAAFADPTGDDAAVLRTTLRSLDAQISRLQARRVRDTRADRLVRVRGIDRATWDALPLDRRRSAVADLYRIVIHPAKRGRGFDAASIELVRL